MKIKHKILFYFSTSVSIITFITFVLIHILFSEYREEEFQLQQFDKIKTTIKLIEKYKDQSAEISFLLDEQDIYDFYDEKVFVFNENKQLIFESLDDLKINQAETVLSQLSPENDWIEIKEGNYDLIGVYHQRNGIGYYALSKAYDENGHTKLNFLRNSLIVTFILIIVVIFFVSIYIAKMISKPLVELETKINNYDLSKESQSLISIDTTTKELNSLTDRFNELLSHTQDMFRFQKHTINHISHQLKTPIAVLVSELEKIQNESKDVEIQQKIRQQKIKAKSLGGIINVLLEISKIESGQTVKKQFSRVDELTFDCINELSIVYPGFEFNVNYLPAQTKEEDLIININRTLLKQAFLNLIENSIVYSDNNQANILFNTQEDGKLSIQFSNVGEPISEEEEKMLFKYFFRGKNSEKKGGHGLGLILTKRIVELHQGTISYHREGKSNIFEIQFAK